MKNEEIKKEFYKKFTISYPGDSGIGGNDPQEPSCDWQCYPDEVLDWHLAEVTRILEPLIEVMKMTEKWDKVPYKHA